MTRKIPMMNQNDQTSLDFDQKQAEQLTEDGINTALARANREDAKWSDRAYYHLWKFALNGKEFMTEDARKILTENNLVPKPNNPRAWGGVARRLAFDGIIERIDHGSVKNPKAHQATATIWKIK